MNKLQNALYDVYGKKLESIGFLRMKNFWYRISRTGIASFVGTRKLYRGDLEFWAASQPLFSEFCTQIDNITTPTQTYFNLIFYPVCDGNRLIDNQITASSLVDDEKIRLEISECITKIIDEYFLSGFSSEMTVSECLEMNDAYMKIGLDRKKQNNANWRDYTYTQIEMMLYLHINYERCHDFYKSLSNEWLLNSVSMQFLAENAEKEMENQRFIEDIISSHGNLAPAEYIKKCVDNGMSLRKQYIEQDYLERVNWATNTYKRLISLIESDDYNRVLDYLKEKHERNNEKCQSLFKCESLPFSCYSM